MRSDSLQVRALRYEDKNAAANATQSGKVTMKKRRKNCVRNKQKVSGKNMYK